MDDEGSSRSICCATAEDLERISGWNADVPEAVDSLVHELIWRRTCGQLDAPAVCAWDGNLTYGELDNLSSRLAHHLVELGNQAKSIVPLCFEKSIWTVVAILGVLKAQGGFVLLDPTQPLERLHTILRQVKATHLLLSANTIEMLGDSSNHVIVVVSSKTMGMMEHIKSPSMQPQDSHALTLYVVFTSGSTGVPKGVVVTHGNFATAFKHQSSALGFDSQSRVFDFSSYSFEVTIHNTLATLCAGGCVCIPSESERRSDIAGAMERMNVNLANFTPTVARLFAPEDVPNLKTLILIGEPVTETDGRRWAQDLRLINAYGPAECTMLSTANLEIADWNGSLSIGRGLGAATWVVDPNDYNVLLPIGAVGELLIEGPIVGAGYLHDPERTARAFIRNPTWLQSIPSSTVGRSRRFYRTGDLVQYDSDGALTFIGRHDSQVKIRGQRVELGEVENHVGRGLVALGVDASVIAETITPLGRVDSVLAAFICVRRNNNEHLKDKLLAQAIDTLEERLVQQVPIYMIPTTYVPLQELPTNPSGKTDRRRLREMGNSMTMEQLAALLPSLGDRLLPQSRMERMLQEMWAEVLGIDQNRVDIGDSFLRLGGDSIRAMRLVGTARQKGLSLTVATIFKYPCLCDLAKQIKLDGGQNETNIQPFSLLESDLDIRGALTQVAIQCDMDEQQIEDIFPCTPLQEGLIAMTAKHPEDYTDRLAFALDGYMKINLHRLEGAWQKLAMDVPILRTRIVDLKKQGLVQAVVKEQLSYTVVDDDLQHHIRNDKERKTGLGKPLNWLAVVKGKEQWYAVWTIHHALYDGWSLPAMLRKVEDYYFGVPQSRQEPFQSLVRHILELNKEQTLSYWTKQLARCEAVVFPELPKPLYEAHADGLVEHCVMSVQWPRDVTASTVVRAAWSLLIARYTDSDDVLYAATVTGRQAVVRGIEDMLGPTIATVPVRVLLDWTTSIKGFLQQIQNQALDMVAFEQTGLQQIRQIAAESERGSQIQTLIVIQPQPEQGGYISDEKKMFRPFNTDTDGTNAFGAFNTFALTANFQLEASCLEVQIGFDSGVISENQVHRLAEQLEFILRQLCVEEDRVLGNVGTVNGYDLKQILEWNANVPMPFEICVHELIMTRAQKQPLAPAVCGWDGSLTYQELDTKSTQLAHRLITMGALGQIVPLCFEKSVWTPVAMLGVMKAGATSVALDITLPEDRLRAIVQQVEPKLVVSSIQNKSLAHRLRGHKSKIIVAEEHADGTIDETSILPVVDPSFPLYIVFTSGSTGIPKGVILSHRNLSSAIMHQKAISYINNMSRVFDFASYAFDMAWINFLKTAAYGGCLCIPSDIDRKGNLVSSMNALRVNFAHLTPRVARLIKSSTIPSLAVLSQGGEALLPDDVSNWGSGITLHTGYGPAECTPSATLVKILPHTDVRNIGRGQGLLTWVVCSDGKQLAPLGATGELWLEGPLVGQGYLKDPKRTKDTFVENPPWLPAGIKPSNRRLYRTGDLVRYDENGTLIFVGRRDGQVKIRGQRVELSEVATHVQRSLKTLDMEASVIAEIIVAPEGDAAKLVAFLKMPGQSDVNMRTEMSIGEILAEAIPGYMIPSAYIAIAEIPVTVTGKTDRRRLREIGQAFLAKANPTQRNRERLVPSNSIQKTLQEVWAEVLNVKAESIFAESTFTGLGGDSITAMQVVSRCRARNIAVAVGDILRLRTIQKLSSHCRPISATSEIAHREVEGRKWILSPVQQGYFNTYPQGLHHFNQSFLLKLNISVQATTISTTLQRLITRHPMLRARFRQNDERDWEQYITSCSPQAISFAEHCIEDSSVLHHIAQDRQESFNITEGPLFAADLFNIKAEAQALLLSAHHLVVDLISWRIIWHDIEQCLMSNAHLSPEPVSFRTWCEVQQGMSKNSVPEIVLPVTIEAPRTDYWGTTSPEANTYEDCHEYTEYIDRKTTTLLLGSSNASFRTEPVDILLATLIQSFRQVFHDRNVPAVFLEGHGREPMDGIELDLSETVGWFTTFLPIQVPSVTGNSLSEVIKSVKDLRRRVPGRGQPYFASRYYNSACRKEFEGHDMIELLFNYAGLYQQLESQDGLVGRDDRIGENLINVSPKAQRVALVVASVSIQHGEAIASLEVNKRMAHQTRLQRWSTLWAIGLRNASRSLAEMPASFTLSDFPLLSTSYAGLENFVGEKLAGIGIQADDIQDVYPCTPLQEGIILSGQKGSIAYANSWVWQCLPTSSDAEISPQLLEDAWRSTTRRHSIFSIIFVNHPESGRFVQVQLRNPHARVAHMECASGSAAEYLQEMKKPSFSAGEPEHAVTFCQALKSGEVACRLDISHALFDAASIPVLARDLARIYSGKSLPAAPSIRDVVQNLESTPKSERLTYWMTYLANVKACNLPDFEPTSQSNSCGQILALTNATMAIDEFCRRRHITRSVFIQVAWALVLSYHTGMVDICYGYLASGRNAPIDQIEELVAPLINMLVSRIDLSQSLEKVIENTQDHSIEHLAHQHVSLADIQHDLGLGGQRLFNTIITVREVHDYEGDMAEKIHFRNIGGEDADEFDMLLDVGLAGRHTEVNLAFRKDFMSESAAQEIARTLQAAIEYLLNNNVLDTNTPENVESTGCVSTSFPAAHIQFFEYIVGADEVLAVKFWQEQFQDFEAQPFPQLPTASHRPQAAKELTWSIDRFEPSITTITVSTMIRAAWAILSTSYTAVNDAIFGATVCEEQGHLAAKPFAKVVPVRVVVDVERSVGQFLHQIQNQADQMASFARMGLLRIRRVSAKAERAMKFQSTVLGEKSDVTEACLDDLKSSSVLIVRHRVVGQGLRLAINYDPSVVEYEQIQRVLLQLEHVLRQLLAPDCTTRRLAHITTVSEQDLRDIWSWNATVPEPVKTCVHVQIAQTVVEQPSELAIDAWDGQFTYQELDQWSTRLAFHLINLGGVDAGTIIPLCFAKSKWMPVAMLGVMKAGGTSIAMDITLPADRLRLILQQVNPRFVLSSAEERNLVSQLAEQAFVVEVDQQLAESFDNYDQMTLPIIDSSYPLYVIFTSGSTGIPKGVIISHQNISSAIVKQRSTSGIGKASRVYDFASYAFDMAWINFLKTMAYGGCLCIPSEAGRKEIVRSMNTLKVNFAHLTPGVARIIKHSAIPIPSLTTVSQGGEPLLQEDFLGWGSNVTTLHTGYGPAECTPSATLLHVDDAQTHDGRNIGRGQGLVTWIVRNDRQELAPIGAIGELWLEGPLVGKGYLNDPERTAAAFVKDPSWLLRGCSVQSGRCGRLYRTGDLVCYHTDGSLIFMGRKDNQVKIRGQRVELAEVETYIRSALARSNISANVLAELITPVRQINPILAAFIHVLPQAPAERRPADEDELTVKVNMTLFKAIETLNERLAEQMPVYMIPSVFIPISRLPVMASGKMDRRRVREFSEAMTLEQLAAIVMSPDGTSQSGERREPQTEIEKRLQMFWASVLGIEACDISATDNFFRVGGDSVQAMRLVAIAYEERLSLTVASVFKYPRLCDLASQIRAHDDPGKLVLEPFGLLKQQDLNIEKTAEQAAALCGVDRQQVEDVFPCTPLQEGLIALTARRSGDYVNRLVFQVGEDVDLVRLLRAWQNLVATTPILRTRIVNLAGWGLVQVVVNEPLRHVRESHRDLQEYLKRDRQTQVELGQTLNWIGTVTDTKPWVVWTIHHALYDGWTLPLMVEEVKHFYHHEIPRQRRQVPFQSFVQHILEIDEAKADAYWRAQLAKSEAIPFPKLPRVSYQPRADQSINYNIENLSWKSMDFTASTFVRAAWALLMAPYTNASEAIFGVTVTGREVALPGIDRVMGPTLVTVPVRVTIGDASVAELLHQVQTQAAEMTAFEHIGLQRIRRTSPQVEQNSQFQSLLVIQPQLDDALSKTGILQLAEGAVADTEGDVNVFNTYAMMLVCQPRAAGLDLQISFDSAIVSAVQVRRLAGQIECILQQICSEASQQMLAKQMNIVSARDLHEIWSWNATVPAAANFCVHDLIRERVPKSPTAPAVCAWDGRLTYIELDTLSDRLAHQLMGVTDGSLGLIFPLCFEKSMWTVVAMLGVMKAGGTFLLLDAGQPQTRLRAIVEQVRALVILSSAQKEAVSAKLADHVVVVADTTLTQADAVSGGLPIVSPSTALYVVFTSGSTGQPKGVVVSHANYASGAHYRAPLLRYNSSSRLLDYASYSFDMSLDGILAMLCQGGCICILSDTDRLDDPAAAIRRLQVNTAFLTPTVARLIAPSDVKGLTSMQLAGEPMIQEDVEMWADRLFLVNSCGPSECSVTCVANCDVTDASNFGRGVGSVTWVVDPTNHERLAPVGATGEMLIEGPIVSQGYLHDIKRTAAAFVNDPLWLLTGKHGRRGRLYKTGDLVRYSGDGSLIYVGRKDTQVKIRGQRVELREVEHHVQRYLQGKTRVIAEVISPCGGTGEPTLMVFVHPHLESGSDLKMGGELGPEAIDEIQRQAAREWIAERKDRLNQDLAEKLPRYMVPSAYIAVSTMPQTTSGKTDRKRLREWGEALTLEELARLRALKVTERAPSTAQELLLQQLWSTILGVDEGSIGADNSFFQLGGDSVGAMKVVAAARSKGLSIKVADIFSRPKLCDVAMDAKEISPNAVVDIAAFSCLHSDVASQDRVRAEIAGQCGVEVEQVEDAYPCTALQEGLIALSIKNGGAYVSQNTFELSDKIDVNRMQEAWNTVIASSAILRTRIVHSEKHGLVQSVLSQGVCWTRAESLEGYLTEDRARPMGLTGALTRLAIVHDLSACRTYIVWTAHHATYDGWSMNLIVQRVNRIYRGQASEHTIPPYKRFIKCLGETDVTAAKEFWQSELDGAEKALFPIFPSHEYQPRPAAKMTHSIIGFSQTGTDITLATLVRAAWAVVLKRLSGSQDVVFGVTTTGRTAPVAGIEKIEGPTFTTLPVRVKIDEQMQANSFLKSVQTQAASLLAHEHFGIQNIQRLSDDAAVACHFQSLLVIQPEESLDEETGLQQPEANSSDNSLYFTTYAITLMCQLFHRSIVIEAYFDAYVVPNHQMKGILGQLECAIKALATAEERPIKLTQMKCLDSETISQVWQWNRAVPLTVEACVHGLVARQAQERPLSQAINAWDGELTYQKLDDLSSRLAHYLVMLGLTPGQAVPLCLPKSVWMPVAMLGVMKAGGTCVPLDVATPRKRLRTIVQEVAANIVVVIPDLAPQFSNEVAHIVTDLKSPSEQWTCPNVSLHHTEPHDLAFVMFTSGSTGRPKGIALEHAAICTSLVAQSKAMNVTQRSRYLQFASFSFDVSISDIFATLLRGGTVCMPSEHARMNDLAQAIDSLKANQACLTPTVAAHLDPDLVPTLECLSLIGEAVTELHVNRWADAVRLRNVYGPVECSIFSTITERVLSESIPSNIGRAIGCVSWVAAADDHDRLAPLGAIGELLIEGPILARGYWNDPDKTATAFIQDPPWLCELGRKGRLYKTGDLVRYDTDGTLIFIGRKDTQVKISGQRVELSDIESHVQCQLPEHSQVVAELIKPSGAASRTTLAAFVKLLTEETESGAAQRYLTAQTARLSRALGETLPRAMLPSVYIAMEALPLTLSGKIDRKMLRESGAKIGVEEIVALRSVNHTDKRIPMTEREMILRQLWIATLQVAEEAIGVDDSFFQLGGDSIGAIKLVRLARLGGLDLNVAGIFRRPILRDMASLARWTDSNSQDEVLPYSLLGSDAPVNRIRANVAQQCKVEADQIEDIYPCTALQQGLMALSEKRIGAYVAQNVIEVLPDDGLDLDRIRTAWDTVVETSAILRTRIVQLEGYGFMQVVLDRNMGYTWRTADSLAQYLAEDNLQPMELNEPLMRLAIAHDGGRTSLVWTAHHAIYDEWSRSLILDRIRDTCLGKQKSPAPHYKCFIRYLSNIDWPATDAFWRNELRGMEQPTFPVLPSHDYQPQVKSKVERFVGEVVPRAGSGITTAILIRAAWSLVLKRQSRSSDVVFGVTISGRNAPIAQIEEIEGPTFATIPVRRQINENMTVNDFLHAVQSQAAAFIPYEQTGLQHIRQLSHDAATACSFQSLLIVQPDEAEISNQGYSDDDAWYFNIYAITLICSFGPRGVRVEAWFDDSVVDKMRMQLILGQLDCAIKSLLEDHGGTKLREIDCLDEATKTQIWRWNDTVPATVQICVHNLIEEQCRKRPNAQAVSAWDGDLTYAELDQWSERMAWLLAGMVEPGEVVPLCFEKSMWTIVAMLAVMKVGAAFVLLDVNDPISRLRIILHQASQPRLILSSTENEAISSKLATTVVTIPRELQDIEASEPLISITINPDAILYLVFTSGSTGTPKGVMITHSNFASAAYYRASFVGFDHSSRVLDFASYSFDVTIGSILDTLINGGCLCVPSDKQRLNDLNGYMRDLQITSAFITPTVAQRLIPSALPKLAVLQLGGEPMTHRDKEMWFGRLELVNSYGPAECSVTSSFHSVSIETDPRCIGRGGGSVMWVVDPLDHTRLMPIGAIGELLIEGPNVGRGYLDPIQTQASWIESPPWLLKYGRRSRLYKTGDLVKYSTDGCIIFVGRKDTQVKIHGQRFELGEVECALQQHLPNGEFVAEIVVLSGAKSDPVLIAFVKLDPSTIFEEGDLTDDGRHRQKAAQRYLATQVAGLSANLNRILPRYMIPAAYIAVAEIPMTASGKTDRKRLRDVGSAMTIEEILAFQIPDAVKRAPTTASEDNLRWLWSLALGIPEQSIGIDDSFFQLGGDSIKAMKLAAIARTRKGLQLTVADVFDTPRLCEMAACRLSDASTQSPLPLRPFSSLNVADIDQLLLHVVHPQLELQPYRIQDVLPTTDFQDYAIRRTHEKPRSKLTYVLMTLSGSIDVERLIEACRALIHRHDALRTVFVSYDTSFLQVVLEDMKVEISVYKTEEDPVIRAKGICIEDAEADLPLGTPCLRFWIIKQKDQKTCLLCRISHAQYDGIGLSVVTRDLQSLYSQESMPSPTSFSAYMNTLVQAADARCKDHWRNLLNGSSMTPLPSHDHDRDEGLGAGLTLRAAVPMPKLHAGVTLATFISAAWALTISQVTARRDLVFGQLTSGRNVSLSGADIVVGACINIAPVRLQLQPGESFPELQRTLQSQKIASAAFEFYGLKHIIRNCVQWPEETGFAWIAQHQNVDEVRSLVFAEGEAQVEHISPHLEGTLSGMVEDTVWLYTESRHGQIQISLTGRKSRENLIEKVLEQLSDILSTEC